MLHYGLLPAVPPPLKITDIKKAEVYIPGKCELIHMLYADPTVHSCELCAYNMCRMYVHVYKLRVES